MRNSVIDYAAAEAHGVTVCGTASSSTPPVEFDLGPARRLARGIVEEAAACALAGPVSAPWVPTCTHGASGCR
ncbi:hypothetical protein SHIRM173S_12081 [Streptomyces hirsutus]